MGCSRLESAIRSNCFLGQTLQILHLESFATDVDTIADSGLGCNLQWLLAKPYKQRLLIYSSIYILSAVIFLACPSADCPHMQ